MFNQTLFGTKQYFSILLPFLLNCANSAAGQVLTPDLGWMGNVQMYHSPRRCRTSVVTMKLLHAILGLDNVNVKYLEFQLSCENERDSSKFCNSKFKDFSSKFH